ncbi:multidrug ABC transporter ATP-binding protein [Microbacterium faecale]|uniref:Fatty acid ABC transporter ATP-binding/permease protein n=1 Tax=Microbacterium faecale TaxID=1804630 RepID=A0A917DE34_9MICO|nr:ABC transporter ATP-binding protein [Microbacterium faecale]GGD29407.1 multidrug ABC transporter ATP-binding protein [Microbacterium faecale]
MSVEVDEREEERAAQEAMIAAGADEPGAMGGKPKDFWPSFLRFLGLLKPHKWAFIFASVLGAIGVVLMVAGPKVLGEATNVVFEGVLSTTFGAQFEGMSQAEVVAALESAGQDEFANMVRAMHDFSPGSGIDFERLRVIVLWAMTIYVTSSLLQWLQGYIINVIMVRTMWRVREQIEEKVNRLPLSHFDKVQRGELISRVTNDVDNMTQTLQQSLSGALTSLLTVVGVLIMMFTISWQLALVALVSIPLIGVIMGVIGPKSQKAFQAQWRKVGRLNSRVEESFSGHALVKVYGREEAMREAFREENEELFQASFKAQFLSGVMMPSMQFVGYLTYAGIAVLGGVMVAGGQIRIGDVQAFVQYSQQFTQPLTELGGMLPIVQSGTASAERVFALLDEEDQEPDAEDAPTAPADGTGVIEFEHVRFSYSADQPLIEDLSFRVEPGQTVAIVGPTGAGKTTLVNLLMRFYEVDGGAILLDGQDVAQMTRGDLRSRTGMVLQDPWLFAGTIRDNIRYGNEQASDDDVYAAAEATYVDRFVHSLPEGYDTLLEEDAANVSAGERQLITIARAFVRRPQVLILDEATSSVDTRTELLLQKAMAALREGRTSFVIAHRLSTIRDADLILVMEQGSIVEQGNHTSLIARRGAYWRLYQSQFEHAAVDVDEVEAMENPTGASPVIGGPTDA